MTSSAGLLEFFCLHRKYLIYNLVLRNLKTRYRKSYLGLLWTVLIPAGSALVYYFVFSYILKVNVEHHLLFILSGLLPWTFFSNAILIGVESIFNHSQLLKKVPMPIQAPAVADTITGFINLLFSFPIIVFVMFVSHAEFSLSLIQIPALLCVLLFITYCMSLILGILYIYLRDIRHLMSLVLQLWFYLTPIMYTSEMIPEKLQWVLYLNPVALIFIGISQSITQGYWLNSLQWSAILGWTLLMFIISQLSFKRSKMTLVEML